MPSLCTINTGPHTRSHNPISAQINEGHIEMSRVMRQLTLPLTFTVLNKQSPSAEQKEPKNNKHIHPSSGIKDKGGDTLGALRNRWRIQLAAAELGGRRISGDSDELKQ